MTECSPSQQQNFIWKNWSLNAKTGYLGQTEDTFFKIAIFKILEVLFFKILEFIHFHALLNNKKQRTLIDGSDSFLKEKLIKELAVVFPAKQLGSKKIPC